MYGLRERDASAAFDKKVESVLEHLGYKVGLFIHLPQPHTSSGSKWADD